MLLFISSQRTYGRYSQWTYCRYSIIIISVSDQQNSRKVICNPDQLCPLNEDFHLNEQQKQKKNSYYAITVYSDDCNLVFLHKCQSSNRPRGHPCSFFPNNPGAYGKNALAGCFADRYSQSIKSNLGVRVAVPRQTIG